jgi:hypothetical protein
MMADKQDHQSADLPTVADLVMFLRNCPGRYHHPWYEVPGAVFTSVLLAAVDSGQVQITTDGGLVLADAAGAASPDETLAIEEIEFDSEEME